MSIQPASDIVLDVARAADPSKLQAGAAKLGGSDLDFDAVLASRPPGTSLSAYPQQRIDGLGALGERMAPVVSGTGVAGADKAYLGLEAFLLQTMIGSMLPKGGAGGFGKAGSGMAGSGMTGSGMAGSGMAGSGMAGSGMAGSVWNSMLAEHLGTAIARHGGIGIRRMLAASRQGRESA